MTQIRQEVKLRDGKVIVRGQLGVRTTVKSADIVLYHKPNMPLAVIEAKANKNDLSNGTQQISIGDRSEEANLMTVAAKLVHADNTDFIAEKSKPSTVPMKSATNTPKRSANRLRMRPSSPFTVQACANY